MITNSQHSLMFGAIDLVQPTPNVSARLYAMAEDTDWGNPVGESVVAASFLQDGELESIDRFSNREVVIGVMLEADPTADDPGDDLAVAEQALMLQCRGRSEVRWTPPSGGATSVFEVVSARLDFQLDDMLELHHQRRYVLTLRCLPFVRSQESFTITGPFDGSATPPATPTETTIRLGSSGLTGWAGSAAQTTGTGPVVGASNRIHYSAPGVVAGPSGYFQLTTITLTYTPASAYSISGVPYIMAEWSAFGPDTPANLDGALVCQVELTNGKVWDLPVVMQRTSSAGGTDTFFDVSAIPTGQPLSVVAFNFYRKYLRSTGTQAFAVGKISSWTGIPFASGTGGSQQSIALEVPGSARTQGSIHISHQTKSLGEVLVHTARQVTGYQPMLTQYRTAGATPATNAALVSGSSRALNGSTPETVDIPINNLPAGTYAIYALLSAGSAGGQNITLTRCTRIGSTDLETRTTVVNLPLTTGFVIYELARVDLPAVAAGSDAKVRLTLASSGTAYVDEWWAFSLEDASLSRINCGNGSPAAGGPSSHLWIDTPSLSLARPSAWLGTDADRMDARHAGRDEHILQGGHQLPPGALAVTVVSTNANNVAVDVTGFARWHTHPRKPAEVEE